MRIWFCGVAALALAAPAAAQPASDADLAALARSLRAAVEARDARPIEGALSTRFVALECSANPLKPCAPGKAKPVGAKTLTAAGKLRLAVCCEGRPAPETPLAEQYETLFAVLGATLDAGSFAPNPDDRRAVCSPALPAFDRARAAKTAKAAGVEPENLRVASAPIPLREKPTAESPVAATLAPGDVVALVTDLTSETPPGWTAIGFGSRRVLYADSLGLEELTPSALCFAKDRTGWKIAYAIRRGG